MFSSVFPKKQSASQRLKCRQVSLRNGLGEQEWRMEWQIRKTGKVYTKNCYLVGQVLMWARNNLFSQRILWEVIWKRGQDCPPRNWKREIFIHWLSSLASIMTLWALTSCTGHIRLSLKGVRQDPGEETRGKWPRTRTRGDAVSPWRQALSPWSCWHLGGPHRQSGARSKRLGWEEGQCVGDGPSVIQNHPADPTTFTATAWIHHSPGTSDVPPTKHQISPYTCLNSEEYGRDRLGKEAELLIIEYLLCLWFITLTHCEPQEIKKQVLFLKSFFSSGMPPRKFPLVSKIRSTPF